MIIRSYEGTGTPSGMRLAFYEKKKLFRPPSEHPQVVGCLKAN
jgi:hypothetical protein